MTAPSAGSWSIGGRVLLPDGTLGLGHVAIDGDRIATAEHGSIPSGARSDPAWTIVPGFVDIHVHGGGGHTMTTGDPDAVAGAAAFHRRHGTTTTLVSFVTAPVDALAAAARRVADWLAGADPAIRRQIAGIHLEGPFLSTARCGAQDPAHMVDPTPRDVERLLDAGRGEIRVVTIAPERDGALDAIRQLVAAGVVAAIGHTDATFEQTVAAVAAGATPRDPPRQRDASAPPPCSRRDRRLLDRAVGGVRADRRRSPPPSRHGAARRGRQVGRAASP